MVDLVRGTPEYFDSLSGIGPSAGATVGGRQSSPPLPEGDSSLYRSLNSTTSDRMAFAYRGAGGHVEGGASLQEENEW
jgi:hypothetical protein